ncbi:L-histidine N(alpha)-methyltransferase [Caldimonas brevitalea]|uniref:ABC transporter ATP-binding protein n=1 Tax=Caldimonas brevitalea TaxID=413882 RepID=A0A0G3BJC5_9BURK|nr:L-histidine N(alpha)-methyltransferase [Caldimonas brevitalea]AKJ29554.1 ABC transporter ATP-binding protein [Caldimonas brevitalea]
MEHELQRPHPSTPSAAASMSAPSPAADRPPQWIRIGAVEDPFQRAAELQRGLLERPAHISPKYFYDAQGCALYSAICELVEYYPTRTETAIFERHRDAIARRLPREVQWVDLGCGDGAKSWPWLTSVQARRWVGVDISPEWLSISFTAGARRFPDVEFTGVATDFTRPLDLHAVLEQRPEWPRVFFYPGSSIGNFTPSQALVLLRSVRAHLGRDGRLLIGVDGVKDKAVLEAAYDDAIGVTAAFNRNVLRVVNRELDADFDPRRYTHRACFDGRHSRIEMQLVAQQAHTVHLGGQRRHFEAGEAIVTEYSYKYTRESFSALLQEAGYSHAQHWSDERGWFHVFVAAP